jgi:hypothetical protein
MKLIVIMLLSLILKKFGATRGLKETSRLGITSMDNKHFSIQYDTLKGHFDNKMIWVTPTHKFYFSDEPLTNNVIVNSVDINQELSDKRSRGAFGGFMMPTLKNFLVMRKM